MKRKALIIFSVLIGLTLKTFAQKLEENKKDDFTNAAIKRTSWETLTSSLSETAYFRISQVNGSETFDLKLMLYKIFYIGKDAELSFKLANGEIVTLKNLEYAITCKGCGAAGYSGSAAEGIQVTYPMSSEQVEKLKANKIVKVRIDTSMGYVEDDIKDKRAEKLIKSLGLL
ncbi:MAG TPA: hypothetical protein VL442_16880 [Mucilaginibacter sp.]|jgi:hypothetical protein|nr:hypothetical protein [Mucilaginibacter sp.]